MAVAFGQRSHGSRSRTLSMKYFDSLRLSESRPDDSAYKSYLFAYAVSLLGTALIYPLTTLYLLGPLESSTSQVAGYFAVLAVIAMVVNPLAATLADSGKLLQVYSLGILCQGAGASLLAISWSTELIFVAAVFAGAGSGAFFATQTPFLIAVFGEKNLSPIYGAQSMIANAAAGLAGFFAGSMVAITGDLGFRLFFSLNAISYLWLFVFAASRRRHFQGEIIGKARAVRWRSFVVSLQPFADLRFLPLLLIQITVVGIGFTQIEAVLPYVMDSMGIAIFLISGCLAANSITVVIFQAAGNRIVANRNERWGISAAGICWGVAAAFPLVASSLVLPTAWILLSILFFSVIFGLGETLLAPSLRPLIAKSAPDGRKSTYTAAASQSYSVGSTLGPTAGIAVFAATGPLGYWLALSILSVAISGLTRFVSDRQSKCF